MCAKIVQRGRTAPLNQELKLLVLDNLSIHMQNEAKPLPYLVQKLTQNESKN